MVALNFTVAPRPEPPRDDLPELRAALKAEAAAVAEALLGPPNKAMSNKRQLRWGSKGSLKVTISGPACGFWYDFEGATGKDLFGLVQHANGCSFPAAVEWARKFTGIAPGERPAFVRSAAPEPANDGAADRDEAVKLARDIAAECLPINGTNAELYLTETRGIAEPAVGWPDAIRFHRGVPDALVAVATDAAGDVRAIQAVHLLGNRKLTDAEAAERFLPAVKQSRGVLNGAAVRLPGDPAGPLLIAEGPETGLSVWAATGHETWIALGSVAKLALPAGRRVVVCRDNDKPGSAADRALKKALGQWRADRLSVVVAVPPDGVKDFNDVIRVSGAEAVRQCVQEAAALAAHYASHTGSLDVAETRLRDALDGFNARALSWGGQTEDARLATPGECGAAIVGAGIGKSRSEAEKLPGFIASAKANKQAHRVLWLVPEHKLSGQAFRDMIALGIRAMVWRGRSDDTRHGEAPCLNYEAVKDALTLGENVEKAVCGPANPDEGQQQCPHRSECLFQRQKTRVAATDVVIAAHNTLFFPQDLGEFGLVVVDESFWQAALIETARIERSSFVGELEVQPVMSRDKDAGTSRIDADGTSDLQRAAEKLMAAVKETPSGAFLTRQALLDAGMVVFNAGGTKHALDARDAIARELARKVYGMVPGMDAEQRRGAMQAAAGNSLIPARMNLWRAVRDLLESDDDATGRIEVTQRHMIVRARMNVMPDIARLPTLLLDATMPLSEVRQFYSRVRLIVEANAAAPHMRLMQVVGSFGKAALCPDPDKPANHPENVLRAERVRVLVDFVRLHGGPGAGVITYKDIEPEFATAGFRTAHFGALVGLNAMQDVRALFVIGATTPKAEQVREMALKLTGKPVAFEAGQSEARGVTMTDGSVASVNVRAFGDPTMEAVRAAVTDANAVQAIGRGRGVRRTAEDPLDVVVTGKVMHPHVVAGLIDWSDVKPNVRERMAARGFETDSPKDAAAIYPDLFASVEAAEQAINRAAISPTNTYCIVSSRGMSGKSAIRYKPHGRGQQWRTARVMTEKLDGIAEWIGAILGKPVTVEIVAPTPKAQVMSHNFAEPASMPDEDVMLDGVQPASDIWAVIVAFTPRARDERSDIVIPLPEPMHGTPDREEWALPFCAQLPAMRPLPRIAMTWNPARATVPDAERAELAMMLWPELEVAIAA